MAHLLKFFCDCCSFWFFYKSPVYVLCQFSIGLFIFLLRIWEISLHTVRIENFPSSLSFCYHLCVWYLIFMILILISFVLWSFSFVYDQISPLFFNGFCVSSFCLTSPSSKAIQIFWFFKYFNIYKWIFNIPAIYFCP